MDSFSTDDTSHFMRRIDCLASTVSVPLTRCNTPLQASHFSSSTIGTYLHCMLGIKRYLILHDVLTQSFSLCILCLSLVTNQPSGHICDYYQRSVECVSCNFYGILSVKLLSRAMHCNILDNHCRQYIHDRIGTQQAAMPTCSVESHWTEGKYPIWIFTDSEGIPKESNAL